LLIVSPDSLGTACPLSGRNSTYRPVQISAAGSRNVLAGNSGLLTYNDGGKRRKPLVYAIERDVPQNSIQNTGSALPIHET
jgi:hypothetical protein